MEGELNNFIMVWVLFFVSASYCYAVAKIIPKGPTRLFTFFPVVSLFLYLPLHYLHTIALGGVTSLIISWLANFKLIMFAFDVGPLADPSLSLAHFVALACLPIKFQNKPLKGPHNREPKNDPNRKRPFRKTSKSGLKSPLNYAMKCFGLALLVHVYDYSNYLHPELVRFQIIFHLFIHTELLLAIFGAMAQAVLRTKVEQQFGHAYLSTSVQNFWSRRWNLMVPDTLRSSIYGPMGTYFGPILGHKWALVAALMGSYFVSGLMHELVFYQMGRLRPKWGSTLYFLLQGVCVVIEVAGKRKLKGRFQLPRVISRLLSLFFVMFSFSKLVLSELLQFQIVDRMIEEYVALGTFVKDILCICTSNRLFN